MKNKFTISILSTLFIALLIVCGCSIVKNSDTNVKNNKSKQFPHKEHTVNGITCKACHLTVLKSDKAGMPKEKMCVMCHETVYKETPVDQVYTLAAWKLGKNKDLSIFYEVKFSHKTHLNNGAKCADCHNDIAESLRVTPKHIPDANTCVNCHNNWLNQSLCKKCHENKRLNVPPEGHKRADFITTHGKNLKEKPFDKWNELSGRHSHECFQCHKQDHCIKCHETIPPKSHTNQWRSIGHGITAGIDRDSCKACHRTDFCFRCHENSRPRSHVANWGSTRSQHCSYCHEPLSSNNCFVCHKNTPSHDAAPDPPIFVRKDWPCRLCHSSVVPLDHFDNGENCENCHKPIRPSAKTKRRVGRLRDRIGR